jgi:uncharacterized protein (DUF2237 family)
MKEQFNVLGEPLEVCGESPMSGFFRDGACRTDEQDVGRHTVCAVVNDEFLSYSKSQGNDLVTAVQAYGFPGLVKGDRWCLCANRWLEAYEAGVAPPVYLQATHRNTLDVIELDTLLAHAVDKPMHS